MNKRRLLGTTLIVGLAIFPATVFAQEQQPASEDQAREVEEVLVTGTRLRLPDYATARPVISVDARTIEYAGTTNLLDFLSDLPPLTGSFDSEESAASRHGAAVGLNLLNLRNLGTERTLVLVDGRRHVATLPGSQAVDINAIPMALVERVDVLTGGASAVYGADGVSGVVNFILKQDFEGVAARAQYGWSDQGGAASSLGSIVVGRNFHEGRGNVTLAVEWTGEDGLVATERDFTSPGRRVTFVGNPADPGTLSAAQDNPNIYDLIPATNVHYYDTSPGGSVYSNVATSSAPSFINFQGNGQPWDGGTYVGRSLTIGGSGTLTDLYIDDLLPQTERLALNARVHYDIAPSARLFGEAKWVRTNVDFAAQYTDDYALFVAADNPNIPANIFTSAGQPGGLRTNAGRAAVAANFGITMPGAGVIVARDNLDLGKRLNEIERDTWRFVGGIKGSFNDHLEYEVSAVWGRTEQERIVRNDRINERFFAAIDVVRDPGNPNNFVCRSTLTGVAPYGDLDPSNLFVRSTFGATFTPGANGGCVPINIFGTGGVSDAARAWINTTTVNRSQVDEQVLTGFLRGDSTPWFQLPAGPVSYVIGGEWRWEHSRFTASDLQRAGYALNYDITALGRAVDAAGGYDVRDLFGEVSIPVVRDMAFAKDITVDAAFRLSDYSTSGETTTWNVGARWRPVDDLMFRANRARAVRAPNIAELFTPRTRSSVRLSDPCTASNRLLGTASRASNCVADLGAVVPTGTAASVQGFITGNDQLEPEEADTTTVGVVLTPSFVRGLSLSLDWYDIEISNAVQQFSAQEIVNNCYDLPRPNPFCGRLSRTPLGALSSFEQTYFNVAAYNTSGWDFTVRYLLDPKDFGMAQDIGRFRLTLVGNHLEELRFLQRGGAPSLNNAGDAGAPEWQTTLDVTWMWNDLSVNYGFNYFSKTRRFSQTVMAAQPDYVAPEYWYYSARKLHDVQVRYDFADRFAVYGGVNNITDQMPEPGDPQNAMGYYPVGPRGRTFYVGAVANF